MDTRVTWLIAVKDGMPYLSDTLASIEAQTYRNWEVLIWDNGSTDGTIEELQNWVQHRLPGRIVIGQPMQLGLCRAELMTRCQTEFCALVDADDVSVPERLEQQVTFMLEHPEVAVVGSQAYRMDKNGNVTGMWYKLPLTHDDIVHTFLTSNSICQPVVLCRRSAILRAGNYRNVGPINVEDYDLWLRVAVNDKLANLDMPLLYYRIHDDSTTQLAVKQNLLEQAMSHSFSNNAPALFGCTQSEAQLLREGRHPQPVRVLYQIARHLERTQGGTLTTRLKSPSFLASGRSLIGKQHLVSRLHWASLNSNKQEFPREVLRIGRDAVKHFQKS